MVVTPAMNRPDVVHAMRIREADGSITIRGGAELAQVMAADIYGFALAVGDQVEIHRRINEERWGVWHNEVQVGKVTRIEGLDEITVEVAGESRRIATTEVTKKRG